MRSSHSSRWAHAPANRLCRLSGGPLVESQDCSFSPGLSYLSGRSRAKVIPEPSRNGRRTFCWVYALGVQGEPGSYRNAHHTFRKALVVVVVVVVVVAAIGGYALYRHNEPSTQMRAMRAFCAALAGATDQANVDDPGTLRIFERLVDENGLAVGGQVSSDTLGLEGAISGNDIPEAHAYLQRLRADCTSDGYPAE